MVINKTCSYFFKKHFSQNPKMITTQRIPEIGPLYNKHISIWFIYNKANFMWIDAFLHS